MAASDRQELIARFYRDRHLAHAELFRHRHKNATPDFAGLLIDSLHSPDPFRMDVGFRGSMKTTTAEEAIILLAAFRDIHNCVVLSANEKLAFKVLHAIRREIDKNTKLRALFGNLRGQPWADDVLELSNGCTIQALGKGQALRGAKDEIFRPDYILATDIEDKEGVGTESGREKLQSWLFGEVIPARDPAGRVRIQANVMHSESISEVLSRPGSGFKCQRIPAEYNDPVTGERKASWEDRFPLSFIDAERKLMYAAGRAREFNMEYLCVATADRERPFRADMKRVEPRVRVWEPVYVMYDPARTTGEKSATTGKAVWSWIGARLVVWDLWAKKLMPDEIVKDMLETQAKLWPVKMGFEADGLNEWALQPIRHEQVRRGLVMPLVPVKAPIGKIDFIKALQIYFQAREVWFTQEFAEAWGQFQGFPAGNIDAPNALAYALHPKLKPGIGIFENFNGTQHVAEDLEVDHGRAAYLALSATRAMVTGALCQIGGGNLRVLADWVREGDPAEVTAGMLQEASVYAGRTVKPVAGPLHWDKYNNVGLMQACARAGVQPQRGAVPDAGRAELRGLLARMSRNVPAVLVSSRARWTLNALSGGYCRAVLKGGALAEVAEEGVYRVLAEGLESFAGLMRMELEEDGAERNYATTASGQRYLSAIPQSRRGR